MDENALCIRHALLLADDAVVESLPHVSVEQSTVTLLEVPKSASLHEPHGVSLALRIGGRHPLLVLLVERHARLLGSKQRSAQASLTLKHLQLINFLGPHVNDYCAKLVHEKDQRVTILIEFL